MICPHCESEYIEGVVECPDCGTALVPVDDFEGNLVHHSDWVIVETFNENYEARMYKANLEGAGIETIILAQKDRSFVAVGDLAVVKLLVKKTDVEDALSVINDIKNKGTEPDLENDDLEN